MSVADHLDLATAKVRAIFEKASARIEAIKPGEKIPATKLAEDLAEELDLTGPQLYPTLKILFEDYPGVDVKRGAQGGIYRLLPGEVPGSKKGKAEKASDDSK